MQWAFSNGKKKEVINIPNEVTPPIVGERVSISFNQILGCFVIESRVFHIDSHQEGETSYGWSFELVKEGSPS